jgi:hypothetical protein
MAGQTIERGGELVAVGHAPDSVGSHALTRGGMLSAELFAPASPQLIVTGAHHDSIQPGLKSVRVT